LLYDEPVLATGVRVAESQVGGLVSRIEAIASDATTLTVCAIDGVGLAKISAGPDRTASRASARWGMKRATLRRDTSEQPDELQVELWRRMTPLELGQR